MLGEVLSHQVYTVMLPYRGYWPTVHEVRYAPAKNEFGKQPIFVQHREGFVKILRPQMVRHSDLKLEMVQRDPSEPPQPVPLQMLASIESRRWDGFGPLFYSKNPCAEHNVTHLVIVCEDGQTLAHYFASSLRGEFHPRDIVFEGAEALPREAYNAGCVNPSDAAWLRAVPDANKRKLERAWPDTVEELVCQLAGSVLSPSNLRVLIDKAQSQLAALTSTTKANIP